MLDYDSVPATQATFSRMHLGYTKESHSHDDDASDSWSSNATFYMHINIADMGAEDAEQVFASLSTGLRNIVEDFKTEQGIQETVRL